jgi:hypothetical protein
MSEGAKRIEVERERQVAKLGWSAEHDDEEHVGGVRLREQRRATRQRLAERDCTIAAPIVMGPCSSGIRFRGGKTLAGSFPATMSPSR